MIKSKLYSENGSAMIFVILIVALVSIIGMMWLTQSGNQIKSTNNRYKDMSASYVAEAGIERSIADIVNDIGLAINPNGSTFDNEEKTNHKLAASNIEIADEIVSNIKIDLDNSEKMFIKYYNSISNELDKQKINKIKQHIYDLKNILGTGINTNNYKEKMNVLLKEIISIFSGTGLNHIDMDENIYKAIEHLHDSLTKIYEYECILDKHQIIELKLGEHYSVYNYNVSQIKDNIIEGIFKQNRTKWKDHFNTDIKPIENKLYKLNGTDAGLVNNLSNKINSLLTRDGYVDKGDGEQISAVWQELMRLAYRGQYGGAQSNPINSVEFKNRLMSLKSSINYTINDALTYEFQQTLYDKCTKYKRGGQYAPGAYDINELYTAVIGLEQIKEDLTHVKCKLGIFSTSPPITDPDPNPDPDPPIDPNPPTNPDDEGLITIPYYTLKTDNDSKIEEVLKDTTKKETLVIQRNSQNNTIESVEPITTDIEGIGIYKNKRYTVKANITFSVSKNEEGNFSIGYQINSYEKPKK